MEKEKKCRRANCDKSLGEKSWSALLPLPSHLHSKPQSEKMANQGPDPYADIDFDEVNEQTGLAVDEIKCLKVCSNIFDDNSVDVEDVDGGGGGGDG